MNKKIVRKNEIVFDGNEEKSLKDIFIKLKNK